MEIIERTRRYHRLLQLTRNADESMLTWLWFCAGQWSLYIFAMRWLERNE